MIKIAIDDGHGRETAGKRTPMFPNGTVMKENEFNEAVALYLNKALKRCGFDTLLVAPETTDTALRTRVQRANNAQADAYISIHANAFGSDWNKANGVESWIYDKVMGGSATERFAKAIHKELISATGRKNRGIKRSGDLYVLNSTKMHAVLVECGFMTNLEEAKLLCDDGYRRKCAEAICKGVCKFYGQEYKEDAEMAKDEKRYQTIEEVPEWGREAIQKQIEKGGFADPKKLDLSNDMIRVFVILDR